MANEQKTERLFAYIHRRDKERFGLLEAVDYRDAKNWLGLSYKIKSSWWTVSEMTNQMLDSDLRRRMVELVFPEVKPCP